jgi:16S rRNA (cytosine1402-N4)-methyltransferase
MTRSNQRHVPVLLKEAMEYLQVREGSTVLDCTLGLAGHAVEIVRRLGPAGTLIGLTAIDGAGEKRI